MQKIIFANWKSHKLVSQVDRWFTEVGTPPAEVQLVVMPPTTLFASVSSHVSAGISLGAQNVSPFPLGAYTGEIAADQLIDAGVTHCLVGHSERRHYFKETNEDVVKKCEQLQMAQLMPVVCVDEPYLESQLRALQAAGITQFVLAYEPLAAIGTGQNVPLDQVKNVFALAKKFGDFPCIYGGSVSAENVAEYLLVGDGALVATASLEGQEFASLLQVAAGKKPSFS